MSCPETYSAAAALCLCLSRVAGVVLISVGATLVVMLVAACLFHFCRSSEKEEEDEAAHGSRHDNYATMQG